MLIKAQIKTVLSERVEPDPTLQKRALASEIHPLSGKAVVVTGVRRSGKSTLLQQLHHEWKIPKERLLSINFSDERLISLQLSDLDLLIESHIELGGSAGTLEYPLHILLDEIQLLSGWELYVDRLVRNKKYRIFLTGSSSKLLSQDIATEMRGRSIRYELFPFSFSEYLILKQVDPILSFEIEQRALFRKLLYSYLEEGGFPEPILQFKEISTRVLQEYLNTIFYKDVMERKNLSSPIAAKHVLGEFCNQAGSLFTVNKTFRRLNSLGYKVQKSFVSEILEGLHDAYAFFPVSIYSKSIAKRNTNPKKLYGIDTGLLNSVSGFEDRKTGHLLENLIYLHLRRKTEDLYYYKTLSGFEVDFVFTERASNSNRLLFIQVCETLTHPETLSRELRALEEALAENSGSQGLLLTMDSKPPVVKLDPKIQILEVIDFLIRKS